MKLLHYISGELFPGAVSNDADQLCSAGTSFEEEPLGSGTFRMRKYDKRESIILIASVRVFSSAICSTYANSSTQEPLTFEKADWLEIPNQTLIVITPKVGPKILSDHTELIRL